MKLWVDKRHGQALLDRGGPWEGVEQLDDCGSFVPFVSPNNTKVGGEWFCNQAQMLDRVGRGPSLPFGNVFLETDGAVEVCRKGQCLMEGVRLSISGNAGK